MERQWKSMSDYTNEQLKKFNFVEAHLSPLLRAARLDIVGAIYRVDLHNSEYVEVKFKHEFTTYADVTSDSLLTLCSDVIRQICY